MPSGTPASTPPWPTRAARAGWTKPAPRCARTLAEHSPTRALAAFVAEAKAGVASQRAQTVLKQALLDLLGCIVAGAEEEAGVLARDYAIAQAAPGASALIGGGRRLSPG